MIQNFLKKAEEKELKSGQGGKNHSQAFFKRIKQYCDSNGIPPADLLAVMFLESRVDPSAKNSTSSATGLIQFVSDTWKDMGFKGSRNDLASMSDIEQMDMVEQYLNNQKKLLGGANFQSCEQLYCAIIWPASLRKPAVRQNNLNAVIFSKQYNAKSYNLNKGLDANKDGVVTLGDLKVKFDGIKADPKYRQILQNYINATGGQSPQEEQTPQAGQAPQGQQPSQVQPTPQAEQQAPQEPPKEKQMQKYPKETVLWVQQMLNDIGQFEELEEDGILGQKTKGAIISFQQKNSLPPNGEIDKPLADKLKLQLANAEKSASRINNLIKLANKFEDIIKLSFGKITLYHGTDTSKLESILEQGLLATPAKTHLAPAVYLTPSFELALTYAERSVKESKGDSKYVVLEVEVATERMTKKIEEDFMDKPDSYESDYEDEENLPDIKKLKHIIVSKIFDNDDHAEDYFNHVFMYELSDVRLSDFDKLQGKNIWKEVYKYVKSYNPNFEVNQAKSRFKKYVMNETFNNFEINSAGAIKLKKEYVENLHQALIKKDLHPQRIKAVWIADVPDEIQGLDKKVSRMKLLPGGSGMLVQDIQSVCLDHRNDKELKDKEECLRELNDIVNDQCKGHPDVFFAKSIEEIKQSIQNNDDNFGKILSRLYNHLDMEFYEGTYVGKVAMTKLSPKDALNYINS